MREDNVAFQDEVQLLGFGESDSFGAWIKVRLRDPDQLGIFRGVDSGKKNGKRYACVLVEIDDDEKPVRQKRGKSQQAAVMIQHRNYLTWVDYCLENWLINEPQRNEMLGMDNEKRCDAFLKYLVGINSKAELDKNEVAARAFETHCKLYADFCKGMGL